MNEAEKKLMLEGAKRMFDSANRIERIAEALKKNVQPGHVDYISKAGAASIILDVVANLRK